MEAGDQPPVRRAHFSRPVLLNRRTHSGVLGYRFIPEPGVLKIGRLVSRPPLEVDGNRIAFPAAPFCLFLRYHKMLKHITALLIRQVYVILTPDTSFFGLRTAIYAHFK